MSQEPSRVRFPSNNPPDPNTHGGASIFRKNGWETVNEQFTVMRGGSSIRGCTKGHGQELRWFHGLGVDACAVHPQHLRLLGPHPVSDSAGETIPFLRTETTTGGCLTQILTEISNWKIMSNPSHTACVQCFVCNTNFVCGPLIGHGPVARVPLSYQMPGSIDFIYCVGKN